MPSRRRGWSSTVRTRISLGLALISLRLSEQAEPRTILGFFISDIGGNGQLNFRARPNFAPKIQLRSDLLRPFTAPQRSQVRWTRSWLHNFRVNTFATKACEQVEQAVNV